MTLEKVTQIASIEVIFPSRSINAAWHTYITEDGAVISGPAILRKSFPGEDISEVLPEISDFVSADYLRLVAENAQQSQLISQLQNSAAEYQHRITELEGAVRTALLITQEQAELIHQLQQVPPEPLVQEVNTAATD